MCNGIQNGGCGLVFQGIPWGRDDRCSGIKVITAQNGLLSLILGMRNPRTTPTKSKINIASARLGVVRILPFLRFRQFAHHPPKNTTWWGRSFVGMVRGWRSPTSGWPNLVGPPLCWVELGRFFVWSWPILRWTFRPRNTDFAVEFRDGFIVLSFSMEKTDFATS